MKKRAALAILLALGLLALFITAVGWSEVLGAMERASLTVYAGAFLASLVCFGFRSAVWDRVLTVVDRPRPYWLILGMFMTASFLKYVTPYGQVASGVGSAAIVNRYTDATYEESLAAVLSSDFINYLPYYTFGSVGAVYVFVIYSPPIDLGGYLLTALAVVAVVALISAVVWFLRARATAGLVRLVVGFRRLVGVVSESKAALLTRENVSSRLEGFYTTLELVSKNRREMVIALVFGHLGWLGLATALYATALALNSPVPFGVAMLVVAVSKVGFLIPTPGGIGGVEATLAAALYLVMPVTVAVATAIAILYRFATYWFTVLLGGLTSMALTIDDPLPPEEEPAPTEE